MTAGPGPAGAATFTVTTTADAGAGSLREAVAAANASADASDTIVLAPTVGSRIELLTPLDPVTGTLILDGTPVPGIVIDGGMVAVQPFFSTSADLTLTNTSLQNGDLDLGFGTLTFDESSTGTTDVDVDENFLTIVKTGPGTTTIRGFMVVRTFGESRIEEGTLNVEGALSVSAFGGTAHVVGPNGTLAGNVASGAGGVAGLVSVEGRVAPTTTTGNLPNAGGVNFEPGSVLEMDVLPGDLGDHLDVSGSVNIASGTELQIVAQPSDFVGLPASTVTLVSSSAAINGSFSSVTEYAFLDETLVQTPDSISITLVHNGGSISSLASTPNQQRVAQHLSTPGASADLQGVVDALDLSRSGEIPPLLDAIGGESLTAFATARQMLGERTARSLHRRTRDAAWGEGRAFYVRDEPLFFSSQRSPLGFRVASADAAPGEVDVAAGDAHRIHRGRVHAGAWLDTFGALARLDGDPGEAELDAVLYGGTLGVDAWIAERLLVGVAAGYARSDVDLDGRDAEVEGDTIHGSLYAGWTDPRGFLSGYGRYAYTLQDSSRPIQSSQVSRVARASWDAQDLGAGAEAGLTLFSVGTLAFQPLAGLDWLQLSEERYTEKSAGDLSLDVDPDDLESLTGRVGARLFGRIDMDDAGVLVPELRGFWQREFGDRDRVLRARLVGAPTGTNLGVRGPELPRDVVLLGIGWSASVSDALQILLDYDALLDSDRVEHQGNLSVRVRF